MNRRVLATCGALVATLAYFLVFGRGAYVPAAFGLDFDAFYCAGRVANAGADPYLTEPLRACEHAIGSAFRPGSAIVLPAPLPAYAIGVFRILALAPFAVASAAWFAAGIAAVLGCGLILRRLTGLDPLVVAAALALPLAYVSLPLGQILPFALFGIALAAYGVDRKKWPYVAVGTAFSVAEPHLALPSVLALLVFGRTAERLATLGPLAVLLALSFVALPPASTAEYLTRVLPAHALSEIANQEQFSLSHALYIAGVGEALATRLASIGYAGCVALGLACVPAMRRRFGPSALVLGPAAFGVAIAPFLHVTQTAAALPAALLGAARSHAIVFRVALVALCVPWADAASLFAIAPLVAILPAFLAAHFFGRRGPLAALVALACLVVAATAAFDRISTPRAVAMPPVLPSSLAEVPWREAIERGEFAREAFFAVVKAPTEVAILLVVAGCIGAPRRFLGKVAP